MKNHFYVYYLLDSWEERIIYIGRSKHNPLNEFGRKQDFERIHGIVTVLGVCQRFTSSRKSKEVERKLIRRHLPEYNISYVPKKLQPKWHYLTP